MFADLSKSPQCSMKLQVNVYISCVFDWILNGITLQCVAEIHILHNLGLAVLI